MSRARALWRPRAEAACGTDGCRAGGPAECRQVVEFMYEQVVPRPGEVVATLRAFLQ